VDKSWGGQIRRDDGIPGISTFIAHDDLKVSKSGKTHPEELQRTDILLSLERGFQKIGLVFQELGYIVRVRGVLVIL